MKTNDESTAYAIRAKALAEIGADGSVTYKVVDPMGNHQGMTVTPEVARQLHEVLGELLGEPCQAPVSSHPTF